MSGILRVAWVLAVGCSCWAQRPVARPVPVTTTAAPTTVSAAASAVLLQMASHAGVIFSGQVLSVERGNGFVDVRFRVDEAVRGVAANASKTSTYTLREWSGLWFGRPDRYRVGQRFLLLLAERGLAGMSAPVGGQDGAIPLIATGVGPVADAAGVAPADASVGPAAPAVDLRWIEARAVRTAVAPQGPGMGSWMGVVGPLRTAGTMAVPPASLASVLALLRGPGLSASSEVRHARY